MPELPEIEHLRRTLLPWLIGARVESVDLRRTDVVRSRGRNLRRQLLEGARVTGLDRHGKNLAIIADDGRVVCVHLGMSGQLCVVGRGDPFLKADHVHCRWTLASRRGDRCLVFRDPRRFGGLWPFESVDDLRTHRWSKLGPDALHVTPAVLARQLGTSRRPIKAALLDQAMIAGVGNIYADEALFLAGIHPRRPASRLDDASRRRLVTSLRRVLRAAIRSGGSTIRSYVDGTGRNGSFVNQHFVYGRARSPCLRCGRPLQGQTIAQRTSVFCPGCQGSR